MKKKEFLVISIIVIVMILVITVIKNKKSDKEKNIQTYQDISVQTMQDGTKLNTSSKLKETKKVGNIEISNIQITYKNGKSTLLADVKNIGNTKIKEMNLEIKLLDTEGKEIGTLKGLLGTIPSGGSAQLNVSSTKDFSDIYDFKIIIK